LTIITGSLIKNYYSESLLCDPSSPNRPLVAKCDQGENDRKPETGRN